MQADQKRFLRLLRHDALVSASAGVRGFQSLHNDRQSATLLRNHVTNEQLWVTRVLHKSTTTRAGQAGTSGHGDFGDMPRNNGFVCHPE